MMHLLRAAARRPRVWTLCVAAGLPVLFVVLSPLLALLGYLTELFAPQRVGDLDVLILLALTVTAVLVGAVLAVVAAVLAVAGTVVASVVAFFAYVFSRFER